MNSQDIQIGLRVCIKPKGMNALVVGPPEAYTSKAKLVPVKYENSTRYEYIIHTELKALPKKQQYQALGGNHTRPTKSI